MAGDHTSHARIEVDVNDRDAIARLKEIQRELHSTMSEIDREKAEIEIGADLSDLNDAVANAKRKVRELEGMHAEIEMGIRDGDLEEVAGELKAAKQEVKSLDGMRAEVEIEVKGKEKYLKDQEALRKADERREKAVQDAAKKSDAVLKKLADDNLKRVNKEARVRQSLNRQRLREEADDARAVEKQARVRESLNKQRIRELSTAEREAHAVERRAQLEERETKRREREISEVPVLEAAYSKLQRRLETLGQAKRKARGNDERVFDIGLDERATLAKMDHLRSEVHRRVGRDPIHLDIMPSFSERAGRDLRQSLDRHFIHSGTFLGAAMGAGSEFGQNMGRSAVMTWRRAGERGIKNSLKDVGRLAGRVGENAGRSFADGMAGVGNKIVHGLEGLSDMTVRLGPFTTSIKGLVVGLSVLGPILVDVVAALGSLVSVAGAAALGVGALGAGLAGGAIPAFLGMGLVVKGMVKDFQNVQKAQKKYDDAVLKSGQNSKPAKKALEEMKHVMGGVSTETAKTFASWSDLKKSFHDRTSAGRASAFTAMADGIKTASALMPMFARRTNESMAVAQKGLSGWMKGLRSQAGRSAISEMMDNFNKSMGPVLHGLGQIGAYLGRIGQIASRRLPAFAREFDNWAKSINSVDTHHLTDQVRGLIQNAKDVGKFFMAAGRLIKTFFAGGVDAGDNFVNTMTDAMDRWTAFLQTGKGQNSLQNFFRQGVQGAQALFSLLAPIAASFVRWAEVLAPISRLFFQVSGDISSFAAKLLSLTALRAPLTGIVTTLGLLWSVGKISTAASAVAGFTRALFGLAGAEKAVAEGGALMKGAGVLGGLGKGAKAARAAETAVSGEQIAMDVGAASGAARGAEQTAGKMGLLSKAVAGVGTAFGLTSEAGAILATGGLALVAGAAVYGGYKLLSMKSASEKLHDALKNVDVNTQNYNTTTRALLGIQNAAGKSMHDYKQSVGEVAGLKKHLNNLEKSGKKNTDEYRTTLDNLNQALNTRAQNYRDSRKLFAAASTAEQKHVELSNKLKDAQDLESKAGKRLSDQRQALYDQGMRGKQIDLQTKDAAKDLADARARVAEVARAEAAADRAAIVGQLNYQRGLHGLIPLAGRAATAMAKLSKRAPNMTQTISLKYADPKDAGAVANKANSALKAGVSSKIVTKIVADSSSAEEAIRRINDATIEEKVLRFREHGGKDVIGMLERVSGHTLGPKTQRILEKGGAAAISKLKEILGIHLSNKDFRAWLKTNAPGLLSQIKAEIDGLHNKTVTLTTNRRINTFIHQQSGGGKVKVRARGRSAGARETALVGEGRAHEYVTDSAKGTIMKVAQPTFMNLSPSQAVIPTEPRYRSRGRSIFAEIARDLGLGAFAGGKHHKKKPKHYQHDTKAKAPGHKRNPNAAKKVKLPVPDVWSKGGASQDAVTALEQYIGQREGREKTLNAQIANKITAFKRTAAGKAGARSRKHITQDLEKLRDKKDIAVYGDKHSKGQAGMSIENLRARLNDYNKVQDRLTVLESSINTDASKMATASQQYDRGDDSAKGRWTAANTERTALLKEARDLVTAAAVAASDSKTKAALFADAESKGTDYDQSANEPALIRDPVELTPAQQATQDNIKTYGGSGDEANAADATLSGLMRDAALAALNNVSDDPSTIYSDEGAASLTDDLAAAHNVTEFWRGVLANVNVPGADPDQVRNAAEQLGTAQTNESGLRDQVNAPPATTVAAQQMSYGTSRADLYKNFGSNFSLASNMGLTDDRGRGGGSSLFQPSPGYAWGAPGSMQSPQAGGITFNQTFQQMPDPHTWSQGVAFELQAAI